MVAPPTVELSPQACVARTILIPTYIPRISINCHGLRVHGFTRSANDALIKIVAWLRCVRVIECGKLDLISH